MNEIKIPRVIISYSWTTLDHEQWVQDFATELVEVHRIDVELDKWSTQEGDDLNVFMESMVTDPNKEDLIPIFQGFKDNKLRSPEWGMYKINPDYYVNYQELCTRV